MIIIIGHILEREREREREREVEIYRRWVWSNHNGVGGFIGPARDPLPQLLSNERHEWMQQLQAKVEARVERVLAASARLGGTALHQRFDGFL